jgi:DNA-binding XRE family transcriptional regulator
MNIDGKKLFEARINAKMNRMEIGAFMGVTYQRIAQLEKEGKHKINEHILKAVAKFLSVKPEELQ